MRRFYIAPDQWGEDESVITGPEAHHLCAVLRLQPGDRVVVFDGTGREHRARVVEVDRKIVRVEMMEAIPADREPQVSLTLAQGYLKDKKMDGLVRQLTELGVARWIPFLSRRSIPMPEARRMKGRYERWQKISLEALKQCGRSRQMAIDAVVSFEEVLARSREYDRKLIFWEGNKTATVKPPDSGNPPANVLILLGPEGGFEPAEVARAEAEGFTAAGLGPRTLKAETATLAAAVLSQFIFGDMG